MDAMMIHRTSIRLIALTAIVWLSGCKKQEAGPLAPNSTGTGGGAPVSPAVRQASLTAVNTMYRQVDWTNPHAAKQTLLQFLRNRPEFEASDTNADAGLWARFTDGRLLIIAKNRKSDSVDASLPGLRSLVNKVAVAGGELPVGKKASVLNAMGTAFRNPTPLLASMLRQQGYNVSTVSPTVDNLAAIKGDAVFYLDSHGDDGTLRDGTQLYCVWTSTPFDTTSDILYQAMWANHELAYFDADVDQTGGVSGPVTSETRFAITKFFVISRMSFAQNSLVYIDACNSNSANFVNACIVSSAGYSAAYAGWTGPAPDDRASKVAYFTIDRLLGTNMDPFNPENPPQRPFPYPDVMQELSNRNLALYTWKDGEQSSFTIRPGTASFGLLAPSIEHLEVDERDQRLIIIGRFGSDGSDAKATINGQQMPITRWSIGEVWCTIPTTGANTSGDVKLVVHGDSSNSVRLTEWKGEVKMEATFPGSLQYSVTFEFHVRGDVHSFRTVPGGTPNPQPYVGFVGMKDSYVNLSAGGTITDNYSPGGGCTEYLSDSWPSATKRISADSSGGRGIVIGGDMHTQSKTLSLYLAAAADTFVTDNFTDSIVCPNSQPQVAHFSAPAPFGEGDTLLVTLNQTYDMMPIPAYNRKSKMFPMIYSLDPNLSYGSATVTFLGATAINPPDPKAGQ